MTISHSRRIGAALLAAAVSAVMMVGCSAGSSQPTPDKVTLTWWGWNAPTPDKAIKEFEAANPNVTVKFKQYAYNDYVTAIRTGLTSSDGPDVFQLQPGDLVTNFGPLAVPLKDHLTATYGADWAKKFYDEGLSQLQLDGSQVGLPSYMSAAGFIYYNATLLEAAGASVPTTFSEWKDACAKLATTGVDCLAHGAKDAWVNTDVYLSLINSVAPGKVYDAIDGKAKWTDPEFVQAMDAWHELFTSGIIADGSTAMAEYPDAFSAFLAGKAAFIALGTWNTPGTMTHTGMVDSQKTVTTPITGIFLSAPFPAPADDLKPTAPFGGPDNGWAVSAKSSKQEAALKFLDYLSVGDGQKLQAAIGNIPAIVSIPVETTDVIDPRQVADIQRQQTDLQNLIGARQIPYSDLGAALGDALSAVAAGTSSSADALAKVEAASSSLSR